MEPHIEKCLLYVAIAKDIWNMTHKLYSNRKNTSRLYNENSRYT